jgi:hypothetical protein
MCAATAFPVRRLNVKRQDTTADVPDFVTVTVKVPRARRTLPLGFGLSWLARSATFALAVDDTWPRISPAGFVLVWTFTYAVPFWIASSTVALMFAVPVAPLVHGVQRGTTTGPALPGSPM